MYSLGVSGMGPTNKNSLVLDKGHMQTNIPSFSSTDDVIKYIQKNSMSALEKRREQELRSMCSLEEYENEERSFHQNTHYTSQSISRPYNSRRSDSTMPFAQGPGTTNKNLLVHEKEHMQSDIPISPPDEQVMQSTQKVETSTLRKGRGRELRSMCSFDESENEERFFHQNGHYASQSTVGKGRGRELRSMCSFEESENEERSFHQNAHYARQSMSRPSKSTRLDSTCLPLKNCEQRIKTLWFMRKRICKLIFHFLLLLIKLCSPPKQLKQARSNRNAANRTKLKMLHHIGSKPIREIIYQKAQIKELVQSELSLPIIEIVEKCFGPQSCSHVFGLGSGVKAKDLKGGTSSKTELLTKLRATENEDQSLKDRLSNFENEMKEVRQLKELLLAQQTYF